MTIYLWAFVALLFVHWIGDYVLQSHWQAVHKSRLAEALIGHILIYTTWLALGAWVIFGFSGALVSFVLVNGFLHMMTDFVTSRISSKLWKDGKIHNFFVMIGFDQLIHQITLAATMMYFL